MNNCQCPTCKQRALIQQQNPDKEIGIQYAYYQLDERVGFYVSADEIEALEEANNLDFNQPRLVEQKIANPVYTIAYGVFQSNTYMYSNGYDLPLMKKGECFCYSYRQKDKVYLVKLKDYQVVDKHNRLYKVAVLLESNVSLSFPTKEDQLALTVSKYMPDLGENLGDLIFSRVEYGFFRLDAGKEIIPLQVPMWQKLVDKKRIEQVEYERLLFINS